MAITLIKACKEDCRIYFNWANDPAVRAASFKSEPITWEEHCLWFTNKLQSNDSLLYVAVLDKEKIGQIRLDVDKNRIGVIDYSISKEYRKQGFGTLILKQLCSEVADSTNIVELTGLVKEENLGSAKSFENAGFVLTEKKDVGSYQCKRYSYGF